MPELGTSGLMSGEGKRDDALRQHPRPSSTLPAADRYRRGTEGNGSIQILWRPQIAHWHMVALCGGAGEVIGTIP